jgi:hypothetical protein
MKGLSIKENGYVMILALKVKTRISSLCIITRYSGSTKYLLQIAKCIILIKPLSQNTRSKTLPHQNSSLELVVVWYTCSKRSSQILHLLFSCRDLTSRLAVLKNFLEITEPSFDSTQLALCRSRLCSLNRVSWSAIASLRVDVSKRKLLSI